MTRSLFDDDAFASRLFFPRPDPSKPPKGAQDAVVAVGGGVSLHLRWHKSASSLATLLLFHGNGEVVGDYDGAAADFAAAGADLVVVDYRGYGTSTGTPSLRNLIGDVAAVVDHVAAASRLPLVVMGRSLGSACAAEVYGKPDDSRISGVIYESGFCDLRGLVERRGMRPPREFADADRAVFDPLPKLARGNKPLLVLHGDEDDVIPVAEGRAALAAAGGSSKRIAIIADHGHNDLSQDPAYWAALQEFIASVGVNKTH